jgi:hypothetical protein
MLLSGVPIPYVYLQVHALGPSEWRGCMLSALACIAHIKRDALALWPVFFLSNRRLSYAAVV